MTGTTFNSMRKSDQTNAFLNFSVDGETKHVQDLIDAGAELEALDRKCQTPLFSAVFNRCKEVAQLLLESVADPEGSSKNLNTPLDIAIMHKDAEMLKVLSIKSGNEITKPDKYIII